MKIQKIGRNYLIPNVYKKIPSVTEIIYKNKPIPETPHVQKALSRGTAIHEELDNTLPSVLNLANLIPDPEVNIKNGVVLNASEKIKEQLFYILKEILELNLVILEKEISFYNNRIEKMPYVGTYDLVVYERDNPGNRYLFDYKTGNTRSLSNQIQQGGYASYVEPKRSFLLYENGWEEVDLKTNKELWRYKLEEYYKELKYGN